MPDRVVKRVYKYRFYPTAEQAALLNRTFGCVRYVYNRALAERSRAWAEEQRRVSLAETCRMLTSWKQEPEAAWLAEVSNVPLQQGLRNLQTAFVNFWQGRARYPSFKSRKKSRASATFMRNAFSYQDGRLCLAKMEIPLDVRWSRVPPSSPSSVTVSRDASGRWHVSLLCESAVTDLPATGQAVGVDMGITSLLALSTGEKVDNPRYEQRDRQRLALVHRRLSRKEKGSKNRVKAKVKVAKVYARISDRRRDHLHKLSTRLIHENQVIIIEDLAVRNMVRNRHLARAISDASWSELRRQLEYKAAWYGRTVVVVGRFYPSSKTCADCAHRLEELPLAVREWDCPGCGTVQDRDVNAARNLLAEGLSVIACGDGVRPTRS